MSLNSISKPIEFCLRLNRMLDSVPAAPKNVFEKTNVLDKVMSAENRTGWTVSDVTDLAGKQVPDGQEGTVAKIYMEYEKPYCAGGESSDDALCDLDASATSDPKGYLEMTINKVAERHFTVSKADFAALCENPDERIANVLRRKAYEIKHEINVEVIKYLHGIAAAYTDGNPSIGETAKSVTVIDQNGNIVPAGFAKINTEYRKSFYDGKVLQFGGETLAKYVDVKMYQGMSMNSVGANTDPLAVMPFTYDSQFDRQFQTLEGDALSHGITLPIGGVHLQEFYLHTGFRREVNQPDVARIKMMIDEMEFDYGMIYDKCGGADKTGAWTIQIKKHYGLASIPAAAYCNSQGLAFHWLFNCGDFSCESL